MQAMHEFVQGRDQLVNEVLLFIRDRSTTV